MDADLKKNILSTGTSLVGIVCRDGVVMAGDRKTTAGEKKYTKSLPIK